MEKGNTPPTPMLSRRAYATLSPSPQ